MVTNEHVSELLAMLTPRPNMVIEDEWVEQWCYHLPNSTIDGKGNVWVTVGDPAGVLFSSHVDTVHRGKVEVPFINVQDWEITAWTTDLKSRLILGADDTVGVWIMRRMIEKQLPGTYVFHRAEESGGQGSSYVVNKENRANLIGEPCRYSIAVAFDRRGDKDIITHQGNTRTCSDTFANGLASALNSFGLAYKPCDGGSFTDTRNYIDFVAECTNLSVGYYYQHSTTEYIDLAHLVRFTNAVLKLDWWSLPVARAPGTIEHKSWGGGVNSYKGTDYSSWGGYDENGDYNGWYNKQGVPTVPEEWVAQALKCNTVNEIMTLIQKSQWQAARAVSLLLDLVAISPTLAEPEKIVDENGEVYERGPSTGTEEPLPEDGHLEEPESVESSEPSDETVGQGTG